MMKPKLPDHLRRALLTTAEPVCSAAIVNDIGAVIVKTDADEIASFWGDIPVLYRYELGRYPEGAVIRLYLEIRDQPAHPYKLETFLNPASDDDLNLLRHLCQQDVLDIHFFDTAAEYVFSKRVRHRRRQRRELTRLMDMALAHLETIPLERQDWPAAKRRFQADVPL